MAKQGYARCHLDHCVYFQKLLDGRYVTLLLHVDDMLIAGSNAQYINALKREWASTFAMKDLGAAKQILGMPIIRDMKNWKLILS